MEIDTDVLQYCKHQKYMVQRYTALMHFGVWIQCQNISYYNKARMLYTYRRRLRYCIDKVETKWFQDKPNVKMKMLQTRPMMRPVAPPHHQVQWKEGLPCLGSWARQATRDKHGCSGWSVETKGSGLNTSNTLSDVSIRVTYKPRSLPA